LDVVVSRLACVVEMNTFSFVNEDAHHPTLLVNIILKKPKHKDISRNSNHNYNFKKGDYMTMFQLFQNFNWNELDSFTDVNAAVKYFYDKIYYIFDVCVPKTKKK